MAKFVGVKGKDGNPDMRTLLLRHMDEIESTDMTCRVEIHYRKGEFRKASMAVPSVLTKDKDDS